MWCNSQLLGKKKLEGYLDYRFTSSNWKKESLANPSQVPERGAEFGMVLKIVAKPTALLTWTCILALVISKNFCNYAKQLHT